MNDSFSNIYRLNAPEGELHQIVCNNQLLWRRPDKNLNRVPISRDVDNSIYNGKGYIEGYRLSSNGTLKPQANTVATGFIPFKQGDVARMRGVTWGTDVSTGYSYIIFYNKDFEVVTVVNRYEQETEDNNISNSTGVNLTKSSILTDINGITTFNIIFTKNYDISYIRISATGNGADMMVTINENILLNQ